MSFQSVYTRQVYSGLEPSQAFDVVYGGRFEHRLLSSRDTVLHHQRLIIGELRLETGCYDFPVIAQGCMPEDGICIGFMVAGGDRTKVNTTALGPDEIQIYPAGLELLYHATGPSRWVNLTVPHELLQRAATRRLGFSLTLPRQSARSLQLNPGGCHALTCAVDDALNMARRMQPGGLAPDLACVIHDSLLNGYLDALGDATAAQGAARSIVERRHHHLISSCERLVLSGEDADVALADIAQRSGYSLRSLELIFRRSVGMTPSRWFMTARLNGALRDMLTQGQALSVSEIAGKWGFRHMSRFAQYFRQAFGESPRDTLRRARR